MRRKMISYFKMPRYAIFNSTKYLSHVRALSLSLIDYRGTPVFKFYIFL